MNVSDWVYLGAGIGLGMGFCWLFARSATAASDSSSVLLEEQQHQPLLLQQVKQTQLAYEMAAQMSQFKAGFLARTTHELRSPLNGLIGLHQLILSDLCENPAEEREFIALAHERALKLPLLAMAMPKSSILRPCAQKAEILNSSWSWCRLISAWRSLN